MARKESVLMRQDYPIKPRDIDVSVEPKGFDTLLSYSQRCFLWGLFQLWASKGNWEPVTHAEIQDFIPRMEPNTYMTCAIIKFMEPQLESLKSRREQLRNCITFLAGATKSGGRSAKRRESRINGVAHGVASRIYTKFLGREKMYNRVHCFCILSFFVSFV